MFHSQLHTYTHRIDAADLWSEEQQIAALLRAGGRDPTGLDFGSLPAQFRVRDLKAKAQHHGIDAVQIVRGRPDRNGDIEVRFGCASETDVAALKILLR